MDGNDKVRGIETHKIISLSEVYVMMIRIVINHCDDINNVAKIKYQS